MKLLPEQVAGIINRYSPEQAASLKECARQHSPTLSPLVLERWLKKPDAEELTEEQAQFLQDWVEGRYGRSGSQYGWVKINMQPPADPVILGVRGAAPASVRKFIAGQAATGSRVIPAENRGKDIPEPDEVKMIARRKAEAEEQEQRAAQRPSARAKAAVQRLVNFGDLHERSSG